MPLFSPLHVLSSSLQQLAFTTINNKLRIEWYRFGYDSFTIAFGTNSWIVFVCLVILVFALSPFSVCVAFQQHPHHFSSTAWWVPVLIFPIPWSSVDASFYFPTGLFTLSTSDIQRVRLASWNNSRWNSSTLAAFSATFFTIFLYHHLFYICAPQLHRHHHQSFKLVFIFSSTFNHPLTLC